MVEIKNTNGVSYGAIINATSTDPIDVKFVGTGDAVDYELAIVCSNATFVKGDNGVYTFTPTAEGEVHIVAQRARVIEA